MKEQLHGKTIGSRKDLDEYLLECLCKVPLALLTFIIIKEITELPMDSGALASKKG